MLPHGMASVTAFCLNQNSRPRRWEPWRLTAWASRVKGSRPEGAKETSATTFASPRLPPICQCLRALEFLPETLNRLLGILQHHAFLDFARIDPE